MLVLGISVLDRDVHASLAGDEGVLAAVSEARLTRAPSGAGFPHQAVRECLRAAGASLGDIDAVAYPLWDWRREARALFDQLGFARPARAALARCHALLARAAKPADGAGEPERFDEYRDESLGERLLAFALGGHAGGDAAASAVAMAVRFAADVRAYCRAEEDLLASLTRLGLRHKLVRVERHVALAAWAFATAGLPRALVVTLGACGAGRAGTVTVMDASGARDRVAWLGAPHSLARLPTHLARALDLDPGDADALVALAAHGQPGILRDALAARLGTEGGALHHHGAHNPYFPRHLATWFRRKDIAAAYQRVLEEACVGLVAHHVARTGARHVALAGEVFANTRLVQRVAQLAGVASVWVPPVAREEGAGAALHVLARRLGPRFCPAPMEHAYLGPGTGAPRCCARSRLTSYRGPSPTTCPCAWRSFWRRGGWWRASRGGWSTARERWATACRSAQRRCGWTAPRTRNW